MPPVPTAKPRPRVRIKAFAPNVAWYYTNPALSAQPLLLHPKGDSKVVLNVKPPFGAVPNAAGSIISTAHRASIPTAPNKGYSGPRDLALKAGIGLMG